MVTDLQLDAWEKKKHKPGTAAQSSTPTPAPTSTSTAPVQYSSAGAATCCQMLQQLGVTWVPNVCCCWRSSK